MSNNAITRISVPSGITLPAGCYLGSDYNVYSEASGKIKGKLQMKHKAKNSQQDSNNNVNNPPTHVDNSAHSSVSPARQRARSVIPGNEEIKQHSANHARNASNNLSVASASVPAHNSHRRGSALPINLQPSLAAQPNELSVIDGRDFGLSPGNFIDPNDGKVYNAKGQLLGKMQNWEEFKPNLAIIVGDQESKNNSASLGRTISSSVMPVNPPPSPHYNSIFDNPNNLDTFIDSNSVYIDGLIIGSFSAEGQVIENKTNKIIGHVPKEILEEMKKKQAEQEAMKAANSQEKLRELLQIPNYHIDEEKMENPEEKLVISDGRRRRSTENKSQHEIEAKNSGNQQEVNDNVALSPPSGHHRRNSSQFASGDLQAAISSHYSQHNKAREAEEWSELGAGELVAADLALPAEPSQGIFPENFDVMNYEKNRYNYPYSDVEPSRFSRKELQFTWPEMNKLVNPAGLLELVLNSAIADHNVAYYSNIRLCWIDNMYTLLTPEQYKLLNKGLNKLIHCTILGLPNGAISKIDLNLPDLLCLDLSRNHLIQLNDLGKTLQNCKQLQVINLLDNPLCDGWSGSNNLPPAKAEMWISLLNLIHLTHFNTTFLSNSSRATAYHAHKHDSKLNSTAVQHSLFDHAINNDGIIASMGQQFLPELVDRLNLAQSGLTYFNIYCVRDWLVELRLNGNNISSLKNTGLTHCTRLRLLNLANNALKDLKYDVQLFANIPTLLDLFIENNKYSQPQATVINNIIFATRNLPGSNRAPGLHSLDGRIVTIEEKIAAALFMGEKAKREDAIRWTYLQVKSFGAYQLRNIDNYRQIVKELRLASSHLKVVDVGPFVSLEILDLSDNNLQLITGLEHLLQLRLLKLNQNKQLKEELVLNQLQPLVKLEQLFLAKEHAKKLSVAHIKKLFYLFAASHHKLSVIDGHAITQAERFQFFCHSNPGATQVELQQFKVKLALLTACTPFLGRDYDLQHFSAQFNPVNIEQINLSMLELSNEQLNFNNFINLTYLDVSHNKLNDLFNIELQALNNLTWLDVSHNKINNDLTLLGPLINSFQRLQVLLIHNNPCMKPDGARKLLLANIHRMQAVECELRVVDYSITIEEKVDAYKAAGGSTQQLEKLRFHMALNLRAPKVEQMQWDSLTALNLEKLGLKDIDVTPFVNLTKLRLAHNQLISLKDTGIEALSHLKVLDVRYNHLSDFVETMQFINEFLQQLEFLGLEGNKLLVSDKHHYRRKVISQLAALKNLEPSLLFLDFTEITSSEVVESLVAEGVNREQCDVLKFQIKLHRSCLGIDSAAIQILDLSNASLTTITLNGLNELRKVNLSNNLIETDSLLKSEIEHCRKLAEINLSHNSLTNNQAIAKLFNGMYSLRSLHLVGNKCFPDSAAEYRYKYLSFCENSKKKGFRLVSLNGVEISLIDRIEAVKYSEQEGRSGAGEHEYVRGLLLLEQKNLDKNSLRLEFTHLQLKNVFAASSYKFLQYLNISHNNLSTLARQGLDRLTHLATLDIRFNRILSVDNILDNIKFCPRLSQLYLHHATADGKTNKINEKLVKTITENVRGVRLVDEVRSAVSFSETQLSALAFLHRLCGLHINNLIDIDIMGMKITDDYFFFILAALSELGCVRSLKANENGWNTGKYHSLYRAYCIYALGEQLKSLDGFNILDSERLGAIRKLEKEEGSTKLQNWPALAQAALKQVNVHRAQLKSSGSEAAAAPKQQLLGEGKMKQTVIDKKLDRVEFEDVSPLVPGVNYGGINNNVGDEAVGAVNHSGASNVFDEVLVSVTGTLLTKFEIFINFLQVFGLVINLDIKIHWPQAVLDVAEWCKLFTFDFDNWFKIDLPYQQQLKFAFIMLLPTLSLCFYGILSVLNKNRWVNSYIVHWRKSKFQAFFLYFLAVLLAILLSFFAPPASYSSIQSGSGVPSLSKSIALCIVLFLSFLYFLWYFIVRVFRSHYFYDQSAAKQHFFVWWLDKIQWWRQVALFLTTIVFLPVARVILAQYECYCYSDYPDNPLKDSSGNIIKYCSIKIYPGQECFPTTVTAIQIFAFVFGILYVVGIPLFFYRLIRSGVEAMVDRHGYIEEKTLVETAISQLKEETQQESNKSAENKLLIKRLKKQLKQFYFNRVNQNRSPQTYLYAAYERKWRYWKLYQMAVKLILIVIAFFLPQLFFGAFKYILANILIIGYAAIAFGARPFNSSLEDAMDLTSHLANSVNALFALLLGVNTVSNTLATGVLICVNVLVLAVFIFALIISPILYYRSRLQYKKAKKAHARNHQLVLQRLGSGKIKVHEVEINQQVELVHNKKQVHAAPEQIGDNE
jgi:Leucine-rich repeat (LRR) protein